MYHAQIQALQNQRPSIEAEINAVTSQIAKQNERLTIVNSRLADLEGLLSKGFLRKEVLLNQQIEKSLVEAQVSNLEAQIARLRQNKGDLDIKLGEAKVGYLRQILTELQDTSQRLRDVEMSLGPARRLLQVKAQGAGENGDDAEYILRISRVRDGALMTFDATEQTMLSPGDIVEVKLVRPVSDSVPELSTQAIHALDPAPTVAEASRPGFK
jgi:polysaccharide export outer membrane protein